ncbi:MAG: IS110 family transposase [Rhodospirillales bacterium]|nr:IS110 family transposase [Rhodospirillales bacterium]
MKFLNPSIPTCDTETASVIFISVELSKKSWLAAIHTPLADKVGLHKVEAGDSTELLALVRRVMKKVERTMSGRVKVMSCYEAGYDGFWLHRVLVEAGLINHVIDPASLQVNRRARRAKTDRIDALGMLRALMAFERGEEQVFSVVRVPSVEAEDARRIHRERERLIKERIQHVNRIKGLLATQGIYDYEPTRRHRRERFEALTTATGTPLPRHLRDEITRHLQRLELVLEMIRAAETQRDAVVEAAPAKNESGRKIQHLVRLKAIGPQFATVLVGEVLHKQFANRRQVASYAGLTPSPFNSGSVVREQGISKAGNPRARTTMIEMAWLWLRYQPHSALSRWFHERVGTGRGRVRRITIVAVARKLLVALWRYVETGLLPDGAELKA